MPEDHQRLQHQHYINSNISITSIATSALHQQQHQHYINSNSNISITSIATSALHQ